MLIGSCHAVTHTRYREDEPGTFNIVTQLTAQCLHSSAYRPDVIGVRLPYFLQQLAVGYRLAGIGRKDPEQFVLSGRQFELPTFDHHASFGVVNDQFTNYERFGWSSMLAQPGSAQSVPWTRTA